jgi:hypothetical protein
VLSLIESTDRPHEDLADAFAEAEPKPEPEISR